MSFMWSIYKTVNEMEPITLLEKQLDMWERSLKKSKQSFLEGGITYEMHELHRANLEPNIKLYNKAIDILHTHLK
jgi:hypothetical protein